MKTLKLRVIAGLDDISRELQDLVVNKIPGFLPVTDHVRWHRLAKNIINTYTPVVAYTKLSKIYDDLGYLYAEHAHDCPPSLDNLAQVDFLDNTSR